jgi:MFS family permease
MVRDGSLAQNAGAWLAAANYLGYLVGALTSSRLGLSSPALMRLSLAGIAVSTIAMGALDGLAAWLALRALAGALSAWNLVSTSAWALQSLARAGRMDLAGAVYAGVGLGIASAGLFALVAAQPGVASSRLWLELGWLSALLIALPLGLLGRVAGLLQVTQPRAATRAGSHTGLVISYGALGFGYILPATFLPALARQVVDDPQVFGLAWPIFGFAAAISTIVAARLFGAANRLRVWSATHILMALGVILPCWQLSPMTIAASALAVGSTFMVATMIGMQEARARAEGDPTPLLGLMTAAFAVGQLAGPVISGALELLPRGHDHALNRALYVASAALAASAAYLRRRSKSGG